MNVGFHDLEFKRWLGMLYVVEVVYQTGSLFLSNAIQELVLLQTLDESLLLNLCRVKVVLIF